MMNPKTSHLPLKLLLVGTLLILACVAPSFANDPDTPVPPTRAPRLTDTPTLEPTATGTPAPTLPESLPVEQFTATPTVLFNVEVTFSPTPTRLPGQTTVRIRNMTGYTVNLYRHGRSGEIHFLGWLGTGYYGIYQFPSLGEWLIRYCERDKLGNSLHCLEKWIKVEEDDKEYRVP